MARGMDRTGINLDVDFGPVDEVLGIQEALIRVQSDKKVRDRWTKAMALQTGSAFNVYADAMAVANPQRLHHVYEWEHVGNPEGRLWNMILRGGGANRTLDFAFTQSHAPVPAGEQETGIDKDRRKRRHVFRWKAPIMELGTPVTINPQAGNTAGVLAIPMQELGGRDRGKARRKNAKTGGMYLTQGPVTMTPDKRVQGAFTQLWVTFFNTRAMQIVNEEGIEPLDNFFKNDVERSILRQVGKNPKPRKKGVGITVHVKGNDELEKLTEKRLRRKHADIERRAIAHELQFKAGGTGV